MVLDCNNIKLYQKYNKNYFEKSKPLVSDTVFDNLKVNPNKTESISMVIADIIYGIAGIALLISGIYRVIKFGQGSFFYTENPIFWTKIIVFALVGSLSLYPTVTYILWAIPLSKGDLPKVTSNLVSRLKIIINIELIGFLFIPFLATLMARGIGLQ